MDKKTMGGWIASALIALLLPVTLYLLDGCGEASRRYDTAFGVPDAGLPVHAVGNLQEAYFLWKDRGFKGRVVVHVGRFLHFLPIEIKEVFERVRALPPARMSLRGEHERRINNENFLRAALEEGIVRETYNVLPYALFAQKSRAVAGEKGVVVKDDRIFTNEFGSRRTVSSRLPKTDEPVLLVIDASYFAESDPEALLDALKESGIKTDLAVVSLSADNPEVTDLERAMAVEFERLISGRPL